MNIFTRSRMGSLAFNSKKTIPVKLDSPGNMLLPGVAIGETIHHTGKHRVRLGLRVYLDRRRGASETHGLLAPTER